MRFTALVVLAVVLLSSPAEADEWSSDDWMYATLAGSAGGAGGALGGGLAGTLLDGCTLGDDDCRPAFALAGLASGLIIGSSYGVTWYGRKHGFRGSMKNAVLWSLLGHIASGSVVVLAAYTIDEPTIGVPVVLGAAIGMPAFGATLGYRRSLRPSESMPAAPSPAPIRGALLNWNASGELALGVPAMGLAVLPDGDAAVYVPIAAGRL